MKYLLLAYGDEQVQAALSHSERTAFDEARQHNLETLRKDGYLLARETLQSSLTATTLRVQNGKLSLADGPFAQTTEQLISLFIISASDLNEAIRVASRMPEAQTGPIEIRPIA